MPDDSAIEPMHILFDAQRKIVEFHELVGKTVSEWAQVEDALFNVFLLALSGSTMTGDLRPYRAAYFASSSFNHRGKMINDAIRVRFKDRPSILDEWRKIRTDVHRFEELRNRIAHLVPTTLPFSDINGKANVRLLPPMWKSFQSAENRENEGFSFEELRRALAPFVDEPTQNQLHETQNPNHVGPLFFRIVSFYMKHNDTLSHPTSKPKA